MQKVEVEVENSKKSSFIFFNSSRAVFFQKVKKYLLSITRGGIS